jgi:hypothetical protein
LPSKGRGRKIEDRDHLGPRHNNASNRAVALFKLREIHAQERVQTRVGLAGQIRARMVRHGFIIRALTVRVNVASARMPAQVAIECRADVMQFMKERDHLLIEIQKRWIR